MTLQLTGNLGRRRFGIDDRTAQRFFQHFTGYGTVSEQFRLLTCEIDDGRFNTDRAGAAVQDHIDFAVRLDPEVMQHMLSRGGRNSSKAVCGRTNDPAMAGAGKCLKKRVSERMRRAPEADASLASRNP